MAAPKTRKMTEEAPAAPAEEPVVDPEPLQPVTEADAGPPVDPGATATVAPPPVVKRVRILRNESVAVGGAHYTLKAGATMDLVASVADGLIAQRLAEET